MLYLLTRIGSAKDWGSGLELREGLLGKMGKLEVHHIFPKAFLYKHKYRRAEVNAVANFCSLTKDTNLKISARPPEEYFPEIEERYLGALASQWIPMDQQLWKVENYRDFLEARKELLAAAANDFLVELFHGDLSAVPSLAAGASAAPAAPESIPGGIDSQEEEEQLSELNRWIVEKGLPEGECPYELADPNTGSPVAILDLAWPRGPQEGFSQPVAVLLNEPKETHEAANARGFRYFTRVNDFQEYVLREVAGAAAE